MQISTCLCKIQGRNGCNPRKLKSNEKARTQQKDLDHVEFLLGGILEMLIINYGGVLFCRMVVVKDWYLGQGKGTPFQVFLVGSSFPVKNATKSPGQSLIKF